MARPADTPDPVTPLWRAAQVFRLLSCLYALGFQVAVNGDLDHPAIGWLLFGVLIAWSAACAFAYLRGFGRHLGWVLAELPRAVVGWRRISAVLDARGGLLYGDRALPRGRASAVSTEGLSYAYEIETEEGQPGVNPAVVAMTLTLAAVYLPIAFSAGATGKLFTEFALTLAGAVLVSGLVALTLSPMMCSKLLRHEERPGWFYTAGERALNRLVEGYRRVLDRALHARWLVIAVALALGGAAALLLWGLPSALLKPLTAGEGTKQFVVGIFFCVLAFAALVGGLVAAGFHPKAVDFLIEVEQEMVRVEWPATNVLIRSTLIIAVAIAVMAVVILGVDLVNFEFLELVRWLGGKL